MEYHWPFATCVAIVSCFALAAIWLVRKFEGARGAVPGDEIEDPSVVGIVPTGYLSRTELWSACGGAVNAKWLLLFRGLCFVYLLPVIVCNVVFKGGMVFFFYTEWTFTLLIVYFALALRQSLLHNLEHRRSLPGSIKPSPRPESHTRPSERLLSDDLEASSATESVGDSGSTPVAVERGPEAHDEAGLGGYVTQCVFQVVLPAAILTDLVYWGLLVPLFLPASFHHSFIDLNMHAGNLVLLLIEFALNGLRFPWFRISYFILWSSAYCFLQWTAHGTGITRFWPYPFMNVDTPYAPAWYLAIIFFHGVCAAICLLLALAKQSIWSRFRLPLHKAS